MTRPHAQSHNVLREFCSRFTGSLRDCFESLGEYRQLQLIQTTIPIALAVIYEQFIGEPAASTEASRKEYQHMKCCSLKRHHLEMHYKRMSMLYYKLNGFNDPSLKHVFAISLRPELQPELQRQLTAFNLDIANVSLGKIFQLAMLCLDKISSKILLNTKNPLPQPVKNPTSKSSAKMTKSALVQPTKRSTSRNISINPLPKNRRSLDTFEKKILPSSERRNTITVLFAKGTAILPAIAQISQPSLFVLFNTYNNLPYFLTTKMLNPSSQNSQRKMIIQPSSLLIQQTLIQMAFL